MTAEIRQGKSLTGVSFAMLAAVLFGASTPFSKILLGRVEPVLLAGLLYLGSGVGLAVWSGLRRHFTGRNHAETRLAAGDFPWLAGAVVSGGIVAPILLMTGLRITPAS